MAERVTGSIEGVQVIALKQVSDQRGAVYHMLKRTDPHFLQFGEIYFSTVHSGIVKAWKLHQRVTTNYACVFGCVKYVLYDDRQSSPTRGSLMEVCLGPDCYALLIVPPQIWNGFQGVGQGTAIVANCVTEPDDRAEIRRLDPNDELVPYNWGT